MKKIIPFRKEIDFKTNISEITSISLEHQLSINNHNINGEFIITGDYKVSDNSKTVESFNKVIPFEIMLDDKYDTTKANVDIDDFYYEIINDKILSISIDVCVDKLSETLIYNEIPNLEEKKDIIEELFEEQNSDRNEMNNVIDLNENIVESDIDIIDNNLNKETDSLNIERCIEDDDILPGSEEIDNMEKEMKVEVKDNKDDINDKINTIFSNVGDGDVYVSYNIYIIREGDTIESIIEKYATTEDELKKYNNLTDLKLGDKIIIPSK